VQHECQAAYALSQRSTDYNPDAEHIRIASDSGFFVVTAEHLAYCRFSDATLPTPITHLARFEGKSPLLFRTEEGP
jgi:hypothetical protein